MQAEVRRMIEDAISNPQPPALAPAPSRQYVPPEPAPAPPPQHEPREPAPVLPPRDSASALSAMMGGSVPMPRVEAALRHTEGNVQRAADMLLRGDPVPEGEPPRERAPARPPAAPEPAGPVTVEQWARLDRFSVRDRSHRLKVRLTELGATTDRLGSSLVKLADFEIIGDKVGDGANAFVYLAKCSPAGQLGDNTDIIVVLKVLHRFKQEGGAALASTTSGLDRVFMDRIKGEASGPNVEGHRHNIVHVLGTFMADASPLKEYNEMMNDLGFVDENTAFIVLPYFSGGDLSKCIERKKTDGQTFAEATILDYMSQISDAIDKLQRVGNTHRDLKPDNIFLTGAADGVAIADFGEMGLDARPDAERGGSVQLRFTKGTSQAGGAPGFIAPDVLAAIARMEDGATATIDYSKNDVFAAGLICYKMVMADNDAEPWDEGAPRTAETMRVVPDGRCSDGLRDLVRDMLNPSFEARVDAHTAVTRIIEIQAHGRPGGASVDNLRVERQVQTPRPGRGDSASALSAMMGESVPMPRVEAALRHTEGNVQRAADMLLRGDPVPEDQPPTPPSNDAAVTALTGAFVGLLAPAASRALEQAGGNPEVAADFLRAEGYAEPPPPAAAAAAAAVVVDEAAKADLMQFGYPEAAVVAALVEARGDKVRAADILISKSHP